VVLSATETMNSKNANMSLAQARSVCSGIVRRTKAEGNRSQGYIAVAFSCPFEGPVSPELVCELATELFDAGVDEVIISDTIGAASPTEVFDLFSLLAKRFDLGRLSGHFHDTRALALANVWAALQVGVRKFDSSIGGLGGCPFAPGAAGNLATEDLVLMLHQCGYETGIDVDRLRSAIALAEKLVKHPLGGRVMPWLLSQQGLVGRTGT
jgi:hydroxymethylglutaryl-CoA lyase